MRRLEIFAMAGCVSRATAARVTDVIAWNIPGLTVTLVDLAVPGAVKPENVRVVPTYLLDGQLLCRGNPSVDELRSLLMGAGL